MDLSKLSHSKFNNNLPWVQWKVSQGDPEDHWKYQQVSINWFSFSFNPMCRNRECFGRKWLAFSLGWMRSNLWVVLIMESTLLVRLIRCYQYQIYEFKRWVFAFKAFFFLTVQSISLQTASNWSFSSFFLVVYNSQQCSKQYCKYILGSVLCAVLFDMVIKKSVWNVIVLYWKQLMLNDPIKFVQQNISASRGSF